MWGKIKTSFGLKIKPNGVPGLPYKQIYEQALEIIIKECKKQFNEKDIFSAISNTTVEWWNKIAPQPSTGALNTVVVFNDKVYTGLTVGNVCKIAWRGKLYRSAFCHELLHVIGFKMFGLNDMFHQNEILWKVLEPKIDNKLTIEQI